MAELKKRQRAGEGGRLLHASRGIFPSASREMQGILCYFRRPVAEADVCARVPASIMFERRQTIMPGNDLVLRRLAKLAAMVSIVTLSSVSLGHAETIRV